MEGKAGRWFIKKDHYLNMDEYNVCMEPTDKRLPTVCIGSFQGLRELEKFADMLENQLKHRDEMIAETVEAYTGIIAAVREEAKRHG